MDIINKIKALVACGVESDKIAMILDMTQGEFLTKYGKYVATAEAEANATVAQTLFKLATSGKHPQASIFWMKARAGWDDKSELVEQLLDHTTPREDIIKRINELEAQGVKH